MAEPTAGAQSGAPSEAAPSPAEAAEPRRSRKGKKRGWLFSAMDALDRYFSRLPEIIRAAFSKDRPSRRMGWLHFASVAGIVLVLGTSAHRAWLHWKNKRTFSESAKDAEHLGEFIRKQADEAKQKYSTLAIGSFTLELKPPPGVAVPPGVLNAAEIEVVVVCDSKETRYLIEAHLTQIRSEIVSALVPMDRDELLTREGKRRLRHLIIDKINSWLQKGKVEELYFSKFLLG